MVWCSNRSFAQLPYPNHTYTVMQSLKLVVIAQGAIVAARSLPENGTLCRDNHDTAFRHLFQRREDDLSGCYWKSCKGRLL